MPLDSTIFFTFALALLHTLLPSHWLCFVLVGRAHRWSLRRTQAIAMGAGASHVAFTAILGGAVRLEIESLESWTNYAAAGLLAALGLLYIALHFAHRGHHHAQDILAGEKVGIGSLYLAVTLSPCSVIIPFLFGLARVDRVMFLAVILVLLVTTLGVMTVLVALAYQGMERMRFGFLDRFEKLLIGLILIAVAASMTLLHGAH